MTEEEFKGYLEEIRDNVKASIERWGQADATVMRRLEALEKAVDKLNFQCCLK